MLDSTSKQFADNAAAIVQHGSDDTGTRAYKNLRMRLMAITTELQHVSEAIAKTTAGIVERTPKPSKRSLPATTPKYYVGAKGSTTMLLNVLKEVLAAKPRTLAQLARVTGCERQRLSNALVKLRIEGTRVVNLGKPRKAIWSIPSV